MERIKFNSDELKPIGTYPSIMAGMPEANRYKTPITPRENWLELINHRKPLWIPKSDDMMTLVPRVVPDNVARAFVFDAKPLEPGEGGGKDMFGLDWVFVPVAGGSMVKPGNPAMTDANDWEKVVKFPNIDEYDWETSAKQNAKFIENCDKVISVWFMTGLFERLISFMDFEGAAMALVDEDQKDAVHAFMDRLCVLYDGFVEKFQKYYHADVLYFHDDWGSQRSPFFSLDLCREMLVPYLKRVSDSCHKRGMKIELHSCGQVENLVPAMIEAGIDTWSGQPMNDKYMLLEKYGSQIIIGIDPPCELTPMSTIEESDAAAEEFIKKCAPNIDKVIPIASSIFGPPQYGLKIYELSRKLLNP
ncbi:MAG: uroporphyrinogen decarboxylase family protein [Oscillospiraceae bacterium]